MEEAEQQLLATEHLYFGARNIPVLRFATSLAVVSLMVCFLNAA
jgi:hypothetical protein